MPPARSFPGCSSLEAWQPCSALQSGRKREGTIQEMSSPALWGKWADIQQNQSFLSLPYEALVVLGFPVITSLNSQPIPLPSGYTRQAYRNFRVHLQFQTMPGASPDSITIFRSPCVVGFRASLKCYCLLRVWSATQSLSHHGMCRGWNEGIQNKVPD